ncbi:Hypothetical protein POVR2_LOCUS52 [uncultured virus]|nr:Hypothetical protein POVR2_LOCUS52 [uncultured virus]
MNLLHRSALERLSDKLDQATLSSLIEQFSDPNDEYGWYLRTRQVADVDLPFLEGDWKQAYERLPKYLNEASGLRSAVMRGEDSLIVRLLLAKTRDVPADIVASAVLVADVDTVRLLLQDQRVDATYDNNRALRSLAGNLEMAEMLLADVRVNKMLVESNQQQIVASRLSYKRSALQDAISKSYEHVVNLLLQYSSVTVTSSDLLLAMRSGNLLVVSALLDSEQIDLSAASDWLLIPLASNDKSMFDVVSKHLSNKLLLEVLSEAIVQSKIDLAYHILHSERVKSAIGSRIVSAYLISSYATDGDYTLFLRAIILDDLSASESLDWLIDRWILPAQVAAASVLAREQLPADSIDAEPYYGYFLALTYKLNVDETASEMRVDGCSDLGVELASKLVSAQLADVVEYDERTYQAAIAEILGI